MKDNIYNIYGLNVKSEITFSEALHSTHNNVDVEIKCNIIPSNIKNEIAKGIHEGRDELEFWRDIHNVGIIYVSNGELIGVELYDESRLQDIKSYILGVCMGVILFQRGKTVFHGSALKVNDKAIIISGVCGAGKTTLTTALRLKGNEFITDDLSAIDISDTIKVYPGYRGQRLCEDTMKKFNINLEQYTCINLNEEPKYIVEIDNNFCNSPVEVGAIINIEIGDVEAVEIVQVNGVDKVKKLLGNLYALKLLRQYNKDSFAIGDIIKVSKHVPLYRVIRPGNRFTIYDQINLIEKVLS